MGKSIASRTTNEKATDSLRDDNSPARETERQRRRLALDRLRGIGWDGDLDAMRLGLDEHTKP